MDPHPPQRTDVAVLTVAADAPITLEALAGCEAASWLALVPPGTAHDGVATFLSAAVERATGSVVLVATAHPVTDAVKQVRPDGTVVRTVDRATLVRLALPALARRTAVVGALADGRDRDAGALLVTLAVRGDVVAIADHR